MKYYFASFVASRLGGLNHGNIVFSGPKLFSVRGTNALIASLGHENPIVLYYKEISKEEHDHIESQEKEFQALEKEARDKAIVKMHLGET